MKLRQKIGKILRPLSYRRGWRRTRRLLSPLPLKPLLANLDQGRLLEIQGRYAASTNHYVKYAEVFGVPRLVWAIEAFKPLPDLGARFDCITAFATRFNRSAERNWYWAPSEWNFLLHDLEQYLAPKGQIFFSLNRSARKKIITDPNCASFS